MSGKALAYAFDHSPYKGTKKLIHVAIGDVVNDAHENTFWMANANLATKCSCDRVTVNKALREMVEDGYLEVLDDSMGRSKTVKYRFIFKEEGVVDDHTSTGESVASDQESVAIDHTGSSESVASHLESVADDHTNSREPKSDHLTQGELNIPAKRKLVWDAYLKSREAFGQKGTPLLDQTRKSKIDKALERYSLEDVILAVTGWVHSPWHRGENDDGKIWNDVELLLRNTQKIEMQIAFHEAAQRRPRDKQDVNHVHRPDEPSSGRKIQIIKLGSDTGEDFLDD